MRVRLRALMSPSPLLAISSSLTQGAPQFSVLGPHSGHIREVSILLWGIRPLPYPKSSVLWPHGSGPFERHWWREHSQEPQDWSQTSSAASAGSRAAIRHRAFRGVIADDRQTSTLLHQAFVGEGVEGALQPGYQQP